MTSQTERARLYSVTCDGFHIVDVMLGPAEYATEQARDTTLRRIAATYGVPQYYFKLKAKEKTQ